MFTSQRLRFSEVFKLSIDNWLTGSVIVLGIIAVYWDLKYRKIPNTLTLTAMVYGVLIRLLLDSTHWLQPIYGILEGFIVFFPFFALGGIGAGDVKLIMAIGSIFGPELLLWVILFSAVSGGVISIFRMVLEYGIKTSLIRIYLLITTLWNKKQRRMMFNLKETEHLYIPYGVAILAGIILTLVLRP
jgi:prepilin peptidase CpaA